MIINLHPNANLSFLIVVLILVLTSTANAQLFEVIESEKQEPNSITNLISFKVDKNSLHQLTTKKAKSLSLSIPFFNDRELDLELELIKIHAEGFQLIERSESGDKAVPYQLGAYYRGTVTGYANSAVIVSIHQDELSAVIQYKDQVYNLGKQLASDVHILFRAEDGDEDLGLKCSTSTEDYYKPSKQTFKKRKTACSSYVDIYFECDYQMYQNFSSNSTDVTNYVNTVFAEVNSLYSNEAINIQISEIVVWTTNDNYSNGTQALTEFANANSSGFNGDLAHLLTNDTGSNGGVAYVNQLCGSNPFAYSDIVNSSSTFPSYSWDVQVIAHIVPSSGGTIMSYCHLNSVGIDFNNGFGQEPGDLLRNKHASCMCNNSTCAEASVLTASGTFTALPNSGNGASSSTATHAEWYTFTPSSDGEIDVYSCNGGVDTRLWIHTGSCSNLTYMATSDDDCTSSGAANYASELLAQAVTSGVTYYIEWDNRWSAAEFDWVFNFTSSGGSSINISCPTTFVGSNTCSVADYHPSLTGYATTSTTGATITYSDNLTSGACTVDIMRTWLATDASGNTAHCNQVIDLGDTAAPAVSACPSDITVVSDSSCMAVVTWTVPTAVDNCTAVTTPSSHNSGESFPLGTTGVEYSFDDDCGHTSNCNFNIIVLSGCNNMGGSGLTDCDGQHIILSNAIPTDTYSAEQTILATGAISAGASPVFKAGTEMTFGAGFEIPLGSTLEALIEDCNN